MSILHWLGHHGFPSLLHGEVVSRNVGGFIEIGYRCGECGEVKDWTRMPCNFCMWGGCRFCCNDGTDRRANEP